VTIPATDAIALGEFLDRERIAQLIRLERFHRDKRDWERARACYVADSHIRTTWFEGTIDEFIAASKDQAHRGASGKHWIFPTDIRIAGDRATVESPGTMFNRMVVRGVEVDIRQYCRFFSRVRRTPDGWRMVSFEGIYQRDTMTAVNTEQPIPVEWEVVARLRPSYRFLGYSQLCLGYELNPELLGDDRPDLLGPFYAAAAAWLAGEGP
jgi:hypothetical protein